MHNTAYLVTTYLKRVHNYLDTSKGSISSVQRSRRFWCLDFIIFIWKKASLQRLVYPKMLSNEELLIILRQQINFDRDQKAAAFDQTTGHEQLVDQNRLLSHLWHNIFESCCLPMSLNHSINLYTLYPPGSPNSCNFLTFLCRADPKNFSCLT